MGSGQAKAMDTTREQRQLLRHEVGMLRARESRRVFDPVLKVGHLAGEHESFIARAQDRLALDVSLCTDVVSALVTEIDPRLATLTVWLTRAGGPEPHEMDLRWMAAAAVACGQHGRDVDGFYAITRTGWINLRSGQSQTWKRLRL